MLETSAAYSRPVASFHRLSSSLLGLPAEGRELTVSEQGRGRSRLRKVGDRTNSARRYFPRHFVNASLPLPGAGHVTSHHKASNQRWGDYLCVFGCDRTGPSALS